MSEAQTKRDTNADPSLEAMLATETGARTPGGATGKILWLVPLVWSLFQLWYASPLPFMMSGWGIQPLNDTEARSIHLAFAIFLAFVGYPALKRSPRDRVPVQDWAFALLGAFCAAYLFLFYAALADRSGDPTTYDLVVGVVGMVLLLEATRRALGPPLMVVAIVFLVYTFGGPHMPDVIAHKGASLSKAMSHQWLSTEGVYGVALGVSTSFVFLFVLFGALLERAGAGHYFIQVAFSLLGHMRGGPAKAAVVSSGLSGLISGSSIANVVTTGTFTIPLMKRVGFPATKAGAVEVAASTNGQLTPPIMGAAAFLMVEYVGISYVEVIKHAILPALISYVALVYIVHLEACKANMQGLPRRHKRTLAQSALAFLTVFIGMMVLTAAVYYGIGWIKTVIPDAASSLVTVLAFVAYVALVWYACRYPELEMDDPNSEIVEIPETGPTVKAGLHFLLPVVILVWFLTVERFSPGLSAFWATAFMLVIVATQRPLMALFRGRGHLGEALAQGLRELLDGLVGGAKNMIGIGVATAAAGIVVGTVTLTGIGLVMTEFVEFVSGGNLMLMLIFTAVISLILGMGLPTTANYIVVSTLMAPVIVTLGAAHGLIVPLIAVHLFVFYFGILADDTPPVGLAAFAAAAISRADPIATGIQGFTYDIRTAILPFMFIFNTELLLIGVESAMHLIVVVAAATIAMLVFAAATQGYWLVRTRVWETVALLLVAFTLFRPGFWWDLMFPPMQRVAAIEIVEVAQAVPPEGELRVTVTGENIDGELETKTVKLPMGPSAPGSERLSHGGIEIRVEEEKVLIDNLVFGGAAEQAGLDFDWEILVLEVSADRPPKQLMYGPALVLLAGLGWLQLNRRRRQGLAAAPA